MKKQVLFFVTFLFVVIFSGCNRATEAPEQVAEKFLIHVAKSEFNDAKQFASEDVIKTLETLEKFASMSDSIPDTKEVNIDNMKCETDEDVSKCSYSQDGQEGVINLKKINGEWKVSSFPKENSDSSNNTSESSKKSKLQIVIDRNVNEADQKLQSLRCKFSLIEDKIEGGGWYYHNNRKNKFNTHIEVPVSTNGYFYLKTNYFGPDWIFHKQIIVNIDGENYYSSIVENHSDYSVSNVSGGNVLESLHLTDPKRDAYIITLITQNIDKEIRIRFKGDQAETDIVLSKMEKEVILDCFLLSQYLTATNNKDISKIENNILEDGFYIIPSGNTPEASIKLNN